MTSQGDQAFTKKVTTGTSVEMTYAGALSFARRCYSRDIGAADVVISGIPYDGAVTNRPGCRFGPRAVREASTQLAELKSFPYGFDPFDTIAAIDFGDCFINPHHPETVSTTIEDHARCILSAGAKMLTLGGDHFVSFPLLKAHAEKYGPVALIQFDAHCDTWADDGTAMDHGVMFARGVNEGIIDATKSTQVGLRTYNDDDFGFEILTSPWIHRNGIEATLEVMRKRAGNAPVYITFDVDCLDPAHAPGTGTPVIGGLASWQALELLRGLDGLNLIGMDVVEVSPPYDHAEITALAAATMAYEWLCLLAKSKGAAPKPYGRD
tara:strand:+ start:7312 stop:8280 length:969 start_codon:yes stop_codon:yes gene_type:complete